MLPGLNIIYRLPILQPFEHLLIVLLDTSQLIHPCGLIKWIRLGCSSQDPLFGQFHQIGGAKLIFYTYLLLVGSSRRPLVGVGLLHLRHGLSLSYEVVVIDNRALVQRIGMVNTPLCWGLDSTGQGCHLGVEIGRGRELRRAFFPSLMGGWACQDRLHSLEQELVWPLNFITSF